MDEAQVSVTLHYETGAAEFAARLFGFAPAAVDLARLAGALDGAAVQVSVRADKGWLYLAVDDPAHFEVYETSVRREADGKLFAYIHEVRVAPGQGGGGLGLRAFVRQVTGAKALGLTCFRLWAAGSYFDTYHNGYYTWARFGFDAELTVQQKKQLTGAYSQATTVNEVIRQGGQAWWRRYGYDTAMWFDLSEQSGALKTFRQYAAEKGISLE